MEIMIEFKYFQCSGVCVQWYRVISAWGNSKVIFENVEKEEKSFVFWVLYQEGLFRYIRGG